MQEYPLYLIAKFLSLLFKALPFRLSLFLGKSLGILGAYLHPKRKFIAYANLKCAFGNKYTSYQLKRILVQTYANMGQGIIELALLPKMDKAYAEKNFTYEGFERIDRALDKGKGVILLTGHFGNWEMANAALPLKEYHYKAIAREQKPFLVNQLLNSYRESHGCKVISKGMPIREIIKALKNNEIVGMLVDQDAGKEGIFVDLFNKPASWHRGVMEFALKTGCQVIPGSIIRQGGQKFKFLACEPIVFPEFGSKEEKIRSGFSQFVAHLQEMITKHPDQWLWMHKRWKSSPQRKILILNNGRSGHLHQSQAVVFQLKKVYEDRGISGEDILTEIIDVKFKSNLAKSALYLNSHFVNKFCQGCMRCLKLCLNEQNYKRLMKTYADIIISCGSKTTAVNLLLSKECNAKSIIIMNPGTFLVKKFNLAIIPRHDRPKKFKNTVITEGAPNLIDKNLIEYQADSLRYEIGPISKFKIGLLLGGDNKDFHMEESHISEVIIQIKESLQNIDADVLATTSRRTPERIETLLKTQLSNSPRCKLLVIANEKNKEGVVGGILGLCDIVIVSPESVSMVSEAASSGSYVLVFDAESIIDKRHRLFLQNLANRGYIQSVASKELSVSIKDFFDRMSKGKVLDDCVVIRRGLERII